MRGMKFFPFNPYLKKSLYLIIVGLIRYSISISKSRIRWRMIAYHTSYCNLYAPCLKIMNKKNKIICINRNPVLINLICQYTETGVLDVLYAKYYEANKNSNLFYFMLKGVLHLGCP